MGVRGLTSYIARHAEQYLVPYELHDSYLVIDGDNLACNLYKDVTGSYSAFGGDYDDFYRAVVEFFQVLAECNVHPYVLMDGGYEHRKLRTVGKRLRGKIAVIKRIDPCSSIPVFPLMMKEVFVDAVRDCKVPVMRCVFEADDELAALSRKLNCPVLSYDSDFYIHNVKYIPLITLTVKAHTKRANEEAEQVTEQPTRRLRKNEVRHMEKQTKAQRIVREIQVNNVERKAPKKGNTYKYLDCCIYRIENLMKRRALSKEKLPLFAALLGNDYIGRGSFKNFFKNGFGKAGRSRKLKQQQRRIKLILQWLKQESTESAMKRILGCLRKAQRESLLEQVNAAISGYSNEKCHSYDFFTSYYENAFQELSITRQNEESDEETEQLDSGDWEEDSEDELSGEEETEKQQKEAEQEQAENSENAEAVNDSSDENGEAEDDDDNDEEGDKTKQFPDWFLQKLYPAHLPRFFVDLLHLRKYINNPQIEHFPYNDCHEVALPILIFNFTLLHSVPGVEPPYDVDENGAPLPFDFTYMTRVPQVTNIRYDHYPLEETKYSYEPSAPNSQLMRRIFDGTMHKLDADKLFERVEQLPSDLQLYFLAIVYWLQKSQHSDLIHLHALLICLVVLRTIDAKIPPVRDVKTFQKRFGRIIKKERIVRRTEELQGIKRTLKPELLALTIPERMSFVPESDCYLVQEKLLPHFHMQEIFKKKYDLFSTTVLHAFAEFQSIVFELYALNGLLDCPFVSPRMGNLYSGAFLYNMYDLLRSRSDMRYHVEHFVFPDSQLMFDFYGYLLDWCDEYVPEWKRQKLNAVAQTVNKRVLKKKRQAARKQAAQESADPNAEMVEKEDEPEEGEEDDFYDLNNKFCGLNVR